MASSERLASGRRHERGSIFENNKSKLANLGLVVYLCLGTATFHLLGEFQDGALSQRREAASGIRSNGTRSLAELRERSVRRMWNITNQLNILYESNWTRLVLEELIEFERKLLESLAEPASSELEVGDFETPDKEKTKRVGANRSKSLRRSFVHSLATITTIGECRSLSLCPQPSERLLSARFSGRWASESIGIGTPMIDQRV